MDISFWSADKMFALRLYLSNMFYRNSLKFLLLTLVLSALGCPKSPTKPAEPQTIPLREIPAQRLNYRFEADVPAPTDEGKKPVQNQERNEAVQLDFDNNRPQELLDRTIASPNNQRVIAVYRKIEDEISEFRLDVYSTDGKLIRKITHEEMAVHFPDTILWSPDSSNVAFVAMVRGMTKDLEEKDGVKKANATPTPEPEIVGDENSDVNTNSEVNSDKGTTKADTTEPPKEVITFRTEQIYISNADGGDVKPLTQNEGLIYFYFVWSPDGNALASLATTITEWRIREARLKNAGQIFVPQGRPRLVEKNGRERLLDDYATNVHPVWSPDSAKLAVAFNKQVRIYDAMVERPTQAAIPLNNDLLLASKAYEEDQKAKGNDILANTNTEDNSNSETKENDNTAENTDVGQSTTALPDAKSLVTFNPIINLEWNQETLLYLQTGWVKNFNDETENASSYLRWHRLVLSPQAIKIENTPGS